MQQTSVKSAIGKIEPAFQVDVVVQPMAGVFASVHKYIRALAVTHIVSLGQKTRAKIRDKFNSTHAEGCK